GGDPAAPSDTATLLRLHPNHWPHLRRRAPKKVTSPTSGVANSRRVTIGVYKTRERIHRGVLIRDYYRFRVHGVELQPAIRTQKGSLEFTATRTYVAL